MAVNDISLGLSGAEILLSPFGRTYSESPVEIAREDRTASGRKVKDLIVLKKLFTLSYQLIDDNDVQTFKTIYEYEAELGLIIEKITGTETYTVMLRPFAQERITAIGVGLWGNVTIELEEV
jgi:hypothetical protein